MVLGKELLFFAPPPQELAANPSTSRQKLKQYVKSNNNITVSQNMFDSLFNKALKNGVEKGVFQQPKGTRHPFPPCLLTLR